MTRDELISKAATEYAERNITVSRNLLPSVNTMTSFINGAKWADKTMLDKACEWLEKNACDYEHSGGTCDSWFSASDLVESFRKYMEEQ